MTSPARLARRPDYVIDRTDDGDRLMTGLAVAVGIVAAAAWVVAWVMA